MQMSDFDAINEVIEALPESAFAEDILAGDFEGIRFGTHKPRFGTHAPDFGVNTTADVLGDEQPAEATEATSEEDEESMLDPDVAFRDIDMLLTDDIDYGDDTPGEYEINDWHDPTARVIGMDLGTHMPDFGTHQPDFGTVGAVDEIYTGPDMEVMLNEASIGPEFGVGTPDEHLPEFGTDENDFGTGEDEGGAALDEPMFVDYDSEENEDYVRAAVQQVVGEEMLTLAQLAVDHGIESGVDEITSFRYGDDVLHTREDIVGQQENLKNDVGYAEFEIDRTAKGTPMLSRRNVPMEQREWQLDLGPASAPAGEQITFYSQPQYHFRTEKVMATDSVGGTGTRILNVQVGHRLQRPAGGGQGALTAFFAQTALGNGQLWDTCQPALQISMTVSFVQACTFDCTIFGSAVL